MTTHSRGVSATIDPVKLDRLAEVAIKVGLQLQPGQDLVLTSSIAALPLYVMPAKTTATLAKAKGKKPKKRVEGQREMLLPISGKRAKDEPRVQETKKAEKPVRAGTRAKKAG